MRIRRQWLIAAAIGLVLVVSGGIAYASIPDAGGVVHICYTKSSGAWRVIDADVGQTCKSNESALQLYSKGGADLAFLAKTGKAADSDKLDGQDSSAFLGATATAADSERLGGLPARTYVVGRLGFLLNDAVLTADGGSHRFGCCDGEDPIPRTDFEFSCDTAGGSTLTVSSTPSFRWWWDETTGEATPVAGGYEAEFAIANGADPHSLRVLTSFGTTTNLDLDTWIESNCLLAWTLHKAPNDSPGP